MPQIARSLGVTLDVYNRGFAPAHSSWTTSGGFTPSSLGRLPRCLSSLTLTVPTAAPAIESLRIVQNAAACMVLNQHCSLYWLLVTAHIQLKTLVLAYRAVKGNPSSYLQATVKPYTPAWPLHSSNSGCLAVGSHRGLCSLSSQLRIFSIQALNWWNELHTAVRTSESLPFAAGSLTRF